MRRLTLILAFLITVTTNAQSWGFKKVKGEGSLISETRITDAYDKISVAGAFNVELFTGEEGKVTINAEENLVKHILTENRGGKLIIKVQDGYSLYPSNKKKIYITVPFKDIESVSLSGSGTIYTKENEVIHSDTFFTAIAGSGDLKLDVNCEKLRGKIAGSGDLNLKGKASSFEYEVAGSGDLNSYDLKVQDVTLKVVGSGNANVYCDGNLTVKVIGSGDVSYKGNPQKEDTKIIGSGKITRG